jgi:hypothetical protein
MPVRIEMVPTSIQGLFDMHLEQIAVRSGYKSGAHYIALGLDGVMYDYTLTFDSDHLIHESPSFGGLTPGWRLWDLVLQNQALVYFLDVLPRSNGVQLPMTGVVLAAGDCMERSEEARTSMTHGAVRATAPSTLPLTTEDVQTNSAQMRVTATLQGGKPPDAARESWRRSAGIHPFVSGAEDASSASSGGSSNSTGGSVSAPSEPVTPLMSTIPTNIKPERAARPSRTTKQQPKQATSRQRARSVPSSSRAASASRNTKVGTGGGVMVSLTYADLPQVGDSVFGCAKSKYRPTNVVALYQNFVEVASLAPITASSIVVKSGTAFNVIMPPLDDRVTSVRVLAVGEIRGKQSTSTKYRAVIVQRKTLGATVWGELETVDAVAIPDEAHCEVRTHTRPRTNTVPPYAHTRTCIHPGNSMLTPV